MGKPHLPLKAACRQTRLDTFFRPTSETARKHARAEVPPSQSASVRSAGLTAAVARPQHTTTILSSKSPSPVHSTPTPVRTPSMMSLTSTVSSATELARSRSRSASRSPSPVSSACQSSTASYCSTSSACLASAGRRTTQAGKGPRKGMQKTSPAPKRYYHDYADLLTPPPPVPSARAQAGDRAAASRWGELSVILPWASRNTVVGQNGRSVHAWPQLLRILQEGVARNAADLTELMQALLVHHREPQWSSLSTFRALGTVVDSLLTARERAEFFDDVLPYMRRTAMKGPRCFHAKRVGVLRQGANKRVLLSGEEAFTLMCCSFFSLFPGRSASTLFDTATRRRFGVSPRLPAANFDCLFSLSLRQPRRWESALHKIRCLLQYFFDASRARRAKESRCIEICRVSYSRFPEFAKSHAPLQPFELRGAGLIEEDHTALQVDFANRVLGGGVLGQGCVQEEIRFVVSPELLLSRLVAEPLLDHEAVFVTGVRQHSNYTGYADTFRYAEITPTEKNNAAAITSVQSPMRDRQGRRVDMPNISVVAMDAVDFHATSKLEADQYLPAWVDRECMKAFVSFYGAPREYTAAPRSRRGPIATGNWGCGAFGGDVQLKLLIQWCAASEAGRPVHYYVFDRADLIESFPPVYAKLINEKWTVGDLYTALRSYNPNTAPRSAAWQTGTDANLAGLPEVETPVGPDLFAYLMEANLADLRAQ